MLWGIGPRTSDLLDLARAGSIADSRLRDRLVGLHIEAEAIRLTGLRVLADLVQGRPPGPEVAVRKLMADRHGQRVMALAKDMAGAAGMLHQGEHGGWDWGFLFSAALTIGGGTSEVLRGIIGERMLGLPREPDENGGRSWAATRRRAPV